MRFTTIFVCVLICLFVVSIKATDDERRGKGVTLGVRRQAAGVNANPLVVSDQDTQILSDDKAAQKELDDWLSKNEIQFLPH
ncbi:unnamed protein product [Adineta steineri]|uniref:Uncharacterized protein n=1 Tax=Adineta steineri TaxID=433720 RepID=A0A818RHI0_9BILA|nr:unnamed protein product [Adineta steineri]CAF3657625.1 unnamed protein product [Adineta steineri]